MQVLARLKTKTTGQKSILNHDAFDGAWLQGEIAAVDPRFTKHCNVLDSTSSRTGDSIKNHIRKYFQSSMIDIKAIKVVSPVEEEVPRIAVCEVYFPGSKQRGLVALAESKHLLGDFAINDERAMTVHKRLATSIGFPLGAPSSDSPSLLRVSDKEGEYSRKIKTWKVRGLLFLAGLGVGPLPVEGVRRWHQAGQFAKKLKGDLDACEAAAEAHDRGIAQKMAVEQAKMDYCISSAKDLDARREVERVQREAVLNTLRTLQRLACILEEPSLNKDELGQYLVNVKGEDLMLLDTELSKAIKQSNVEETRKLFEVRATLVAALLRDNDQFLDFSQANGGRFYFEAWKTGNDLLLASSDPVIHSYYAQALGTVLSQRLPCTVALVKEGDSDLSSEQKKLQRQNWIKAAPSIENLNRVLKLCEDIKEQPQRSAALFAALTAADYSALESRLEIATRSNDVEETRFLLQMYLRLLREQFLINNRKIGYVPMVFKLDKTCCERIKESTNPLIQGLYGQVLYQLRTERLDPKAIKRLHPHNSQPNNSK